LSDAKLSSWTPRPPPGAAPMEGGLVRIVAFSAEAHWRDMWEAFGSGKGPDVWTYMPIGPFPDEASFKSGMRWIECRSPAWVPFAILDRASGKAFGTASYMNIDAANGSAEVGCIAYGEVLKRRPAATEAMLLMARRIFDELGYRRYEWKCDADNAPSRRAAERLGFSYEGIFRQHMVVKGRNRDTAWFSITDREWPRIAAAMERWLAPENFDGTGRQRQSLRDVIAARA
jgi:RimJ/RimL family protein N-acetyltransferase